jgi:hypothetical protein
VKRAPNTEISCEDRDTLAFAGFVSFISLLAGASPMMLYAA